MSDWAPIIELWLWCVVGMGVVAILGCVAVIWAVCAVRSDLHAAEASADALRAAVASGELK